MKRPIPTQNHADIWTTQLAVFDTAQQAAALAMLCPSEWDRYNGFRVEAARSEYLAARYLLRTTLSRYANIDPHHWRFARNPYGRPFVSTSHKIPKLRFNISHTRGLVVCAISSNPELGIDAECIDPIPEIDTIANHVFLPEEIDQLQRVEKNEKHAEFFKLWTLKEAYIKARGLGLHLPLTGFGFDIAAANPRIFFSNPGDGNPKRWGFRHFRTQPNCVLSLALATPCHLLRINLLQR